MRHFTNLPKLLRNSFSVSQACEFFCRQTTVVDLVSLEPARATTAVFVNLKSRCFHILPNLLDIPGIFLVNFGLFKQTIQFLQDIDMKKCPSNIWGRDLYSQPVENEPSPVTTRPGLPPNLLDI